MKKIISLILVAVMLFAFAGCQGISKEPAPPELPSMDFGTVDGYTVSGIVTDQSGNPLPGANIIIEKKVRGTSDSAGKFKITGLEDEVKISIDYHGYKFFTKEFVVSGATDNIVFKGTNNYTISANSSVNGNLIYGVKYKIGSREYESDLSGNLSVTNNTGKTTVTPTHPNYEFFPKSMDVYYGGQPIQFTAVPKGTTYSVSGKIEVSGMTEDFVMPEIVIYVDGSPSSQVVRESRYDYETKKEVTTYKYTVYGLDPKKKGGYDITYYIPNEQNWSKETINVTEPTKNANFSYQTTKKFYFPLNATYGGTALTTDQLETLKYKITIVDDENIEVKEFSGVGDTAGQGTTDGTNGIDAWAGCQITIEVTWTDGGGVVRKGTVRTGIVDGMMDGDDNFFSVSVTLS